MKKIIEEIAKKYLGIETLEKRHSDSLDFYDTAVWQMEKALAAAYEAGYKKGNSDAWVESTNRGVSRFF